MLIHTAMAYTRPVLIGMGVLALLLYLVFLYALMVASSRESCLMEEYEWADQARAIQEWKNKRKARKQR